MDHKRTIGFELRTLTNIIKRKIHNSTTKKHIDNLTGMHGWVIVYLFNNRDKSIFQRDFEEEFSIRRSTATKILQLMEKNELIIRQSVDYDARLKKIVLTQKGNEIYLIIMNEVDQFEQEITKNITEEEMNTFYVVIDKIKKNIE